MVVKPLILAIFAISSILPVWSMEDKSDLYGPETPIVRTIQEKEFSFRLDEGLDLVSAQGSFFTGRPIEMDLSVCSFFDSLVLLKFRLVNHYCKVLAEDVILKEKRPIVISLRKVKRAPKKRRVKTAEPMTFSLAIADLQFTNFKKDYEAKFVVIMNALTHKDKVKKISFAHGDFDKRHLNYLLGLLPCFDNVSSLDLSGNNVSSKTLPLMVKYLCPVKSLMHLNLDHNLIRSFVNEEWINYVKGTNTLKVVSCSHQEQIMDHRKKSRKRQDLKKVLVPSASDIICKMIFQDTAIELFPSLDEEQGNDEGNL